MRRRTFMLLPFAATAVQAHSYDANGIKIGHAWALPASIGIDGQAFMPLLNTGTVTDRLIAARSERCSLIVFRSNNRYDDSPLQEFLLEPGKPLAMRPTARHFRLIGLSKPLVLGERFPLVLDFLNAGETEVEVHVENAPGD